MNILLATLSLLTAALIGLGRQMAVFFKFKAALWFFSNYEKKRLFFALIAVILGVASLFFEEFSSAQGILLALSSFLLFFSFLFDFKYIFPEISKVEKTKENLSKIQPNTEVIGFEINGRALAYPLDVVMTRHIVNDFFYNKGIIACYCALCRSGLVFCSEVNGVQLYFKVAGVWRRNMIMEDLQTHSLWQQATGECIWGKLKGQQLTLLSGENTIWESWLQRHPDTYYATQLTEARKGYMSIKTMMKGLELTTTRITPPGYTDLSGLPLREIVFGVHYNGLAVAYPLSMLKDEKEFMEDFNGQKVKLIFNKKANFLNAVNSETNEKILVEKHWWLGWKEFHPNTKIRYQ